MISAKQQSYLITAVIFLFWGIIFISHLKTMNNRRLQAQLRQSCQVDDDCTKFISVKSCNVFCVNKDPANRDVMVQFDKTCNSSKWQPQEMTSCECIQSQCVKAN